MNRKVPEILVAVAVGASGAVGVGHYVEDENEGHQDHAPISGAEVCEQTTFKGEVLRVKDGDTLVVMLPRGLDNYRKVTVRLADIDTPEVFGPKKDRDMVRGPLASEFTKNWVEHNKNLVKVVVVGHDKYGGRIDARVYPRRGKESLSQALEAAGHAK